MTIRRILLLAFLVVGVLPAVALMLLAFDRTRAAMGAEIGHSLGVSAATISADVDTQLFERLQNATTWNHLEVMQDMVVDDVDKRLSSFLSEMKLRYGGVYLDLHAVEPGGRVVASSRAEAIGQPLPPTEKWLRAELPGGAAELEPPGPQDGGRVALNIRTRIESEFEGGKPIGTLVLVVDWGGILRILDTAARSGRSVVIAAPDGAVVAQSAGLGLDDGRRLGGWLSAGNGAAAQVREGAPLLSGRILVAQAHSHGYDTFAGFGWTTIVAEPLDQAMAPVQRMAWSFASLLLGIVVVTVAAASMVSQRIAQPIVHLTRYTRSFMTEQRLPAPPPPAQGEVAELSNTFVQMVEDLDRSRQTLIQASKLAAVGELAAVMAHEIRTPLGILRSSAQMLAGERGLSAEGQELLGFVVDETERLNRLVASMLDSARARPPQREPIRLDEVVRRCIAMIAAQAQRQGVALESRLSGGGLEILGDAEQLVQLLLNLLVNALQILNEGGRIVVATRRDGHRLLLEVGDNGPGISAEERGRVFEPFVFRREGGLGLGLAVVQQIATAHGAEISIHENAGGGALFRIRFPLADSGHTGQT